MVAKLSTICSLQPLSWIVLKEDKLGLLVGEVLVSSPSELAPNQAAELMFSQKKTSAASSDRIGPEETEQHHTTPHMIIIAI